MGPDGPGSPLMTMASGKVTAPAREGPDSLQPWDFLGGCTSPRNVSIPKPPVSLGYFEKPTFTDENLQVTGPHASEI